MDVVSFPKKTKTKTQKTLEQIAPYYIYNPHTPAYFKSKEEWESYLKECSDMSKSNIRAKVNFLHKRLGHWWCEHQKDMHTLAYYKIKYSKPGVYPLMPRRLPYEVNSIQKRFAKNWTKPPPAMASHNYWESFFYNCMDFKTLEKLDIILVDLLKYLDKKKEKPAEDKGRDECLNYLSKTKTERQMLSQQKKRGW